MKPQKNTRQNGKRAPLNERNEAYHRDCIERIHKARVERFMLDYVPVSLFCPSSAI